MRMMCQLFQYDEPMTDATELAPRWLLLGSTEVRHLASDARTSPLTERSTNWYVSAGVVYRF